MEENLVAEIHHVMLSHDRLSNTHSKCNINFSTQQAAEHNISRPNEMLLVEEVELQQQMSISRMLLLWAREGFPF